MPTLFSKPKSVKIPPAAVQKPLPPAPTAAGPEVFKAGEDIKERQKRARGRRASRVTTPGTLRPINDVNILRPELTDTLGGGRRV